MTELTEPEDPTIQPAQEWPQADRQDLTDPQVAQSVARLLDLPGLPAADHESVYNLLHDDLLAALNSDPADVAFPGTGPDGGAA